MIPGTSACRVRQKAGGRRRARHDQGRPARLQVRRAAVRAAHQLRAQRDRLGWPGRRTAPPGRRLACGGCRSRARTAAPRRRRATSSRRTRRRPLRWRSGRRSTGGRSRTPLAPRGPAPARRRGSPPGPPAHAAPRLALLTKTCAIWWSTIANGRAQFGVQVLAPADLADGQQPVLPKLAIEQDRAADVGHGVLADEHDGRVVVQAQPLDASDDLPDDPVHRRQVGLELIAAGTEALGVVVQVRQVDERQRWGGAGPACRAPPSRSTRWTSSPPADPSTTEAETGHASRPAARRTPPASSNTRAPGPRRGGSAPG